MTLNIRFDFETTTNPDPPAKRYTGYRGLYRAEGGNDHAWNQPAVIPNQYQDIKESFGIPFTEEMQWLSWELAHRLNPNITKNGWASVWAGDTWGTNKNGWDDQKDPDDHRRDFVNDRYKGFPLPKVMDAIVFAGGLYDLKPQYGHLWAEPGLSGINCNKLMPSVDEVIARGWYMRCTINGDNGPFDFPQGNGLPVYVPYFLVKEISYTASHFAWWDNTFPPDPLRIY
jgi:hypothetical protein